MSIGVAKTLQVGVLCDEIVSKLHRVSELLCGYSATCHVQNMSKAAEDMEGMETAQLEEMGEEMMEEMMKKFEQMGEKVPLKGFWSMR